ncbi:glycosyltransferase family 2 protein [Pseudacidobacterium ailaaui]|jgi:glycosyltransferase involved in cell wall biosynthesis|uniref:glycosyltransferase family 2 protein n=1 Tax=Pseudacidobacterium ailaaui TaxID=1382359 RepID=UPI00047E675B|nr:glycosyltransferase family 2 protein [Pseudacidobacterium ailaaui]
MAKTLSVAIITKDEETNLPRTLQSVLWADEIIVVDCGSSDRTVEIAQDLGAKVFHEPWRGFGKQKNFAIEHCSSEWVLSLDADEEVSPELAAEIRLLLKNTPDVEAYFLPRKNFFLGRWVRRGGYWPDPKLRLFRKGSAWFEERAVHETICFSGATHTLKGSLIHHAYPSLEIYLAHMNRYSSLGAEQAIAKGRTSRSTPAFLWNVWINPAATFLYNYFFRLGFLDGREGFLLHLYHSAYVSWKYAKAWQACR